MSTAHKINTKSRDDANSWQQAINEKMCRKKPWAGPGLGHGERKGGVGPRRGTEKGKEQTHTSYMQMHYTCFHGYGQQTEVPCADNFGPILMQPMSSRSFLFPTAQRVMSDAAKTRACYNFSTTWLLWKYWQTSHRLRQQANTLIVYWLQRYQREQQKAVGTEKCRAIENVCNC